MGKQGKIIHIKINAGNNSELGYKIGEKLSKQINKRVEINKKIYSNFGVGSFKSLIRKSNKFIPRIERKFPELLAELKSMAEGSGTKFEELMVLNCEEELLFFIPHCTSVAFHSKKISLMGHNEDWLPTYLKEGLVVINAKINSNKFLALGFVGQLAGTSCGLNSKGLAYTVNSLDSKRFRYGIPRGFLLRKLLESTSLKEAESIVKSKERSISSNTMLMWKNAKIEDIESLWNHCEIFKGNRWLIHTNHPLKNVDRNGNNTKGESIKRYNQVKKLIISNKVNEMKLLKTVLTDHVSGVCSHSLKSNYGQTVASAIINPIEGHMDISYSNPCQNKYRRYKLF